MAIGSIILAAVLAGSLASPALAGPVGPILELTFDEGTGTTLANSGTLGSGATGAVSGAVFSDDSAFASGFSLAFDGDTDFVEIPDAFDYGSALTIEMWIKPASVTGQAALYDDYGNPGVFLAIFDGELEWNLSTATHPGPGASIFDGRLCPNLWQHVAGTYDGATMRAWINGVEVGSVATSGAITDNTSNPTHLGADSATPNALEFRGRMDGLRVFTTAVEPGKPFLLCGELNEDCSITTVDALAALRMAVGLVGDDEAADVDANDVVSANDSRAILRIAVGIERQTNACNRL